MLLYLFFDSLLSTFPKKMETEKWPKAADSPLQYSNHLFQCIPLRVFKYSPPPAPLQCFLSHFN